MQVSTKEEVTDPTPQRPTLLATCQALVKTDKGDSELVRILIDQGSEISLISEHTVQRLQLRRTTGSIPITGIGNNYSGRTKGLVTLFLESIHDSKSGCKVQAYILRRLTAKLPTFEGCPREWSHLRNLQLADPNFYRPGPIHIILGSDVYGQVITPELIKGDHTSPIAQKTVFGWAFSGPVMTNGSSPATRGFYSTADQELNDSLVKFWTQEEIPDSGDKVLSQEELDCEQHFMATHSRTRSGRYVVRLPLKEDTKKLGDSRAAAFSSIKRLANRLRADPVYRQRYEEFLEEYQKLGNMEGVLEDSNLPTYYLPHHGVLREKSATTKLRVVFNGSAHTSTGTSLNDILHTGAKLQKNVADVLLWSRTHRYIFSIDIVKMFRQIEVHLEDRDLQRIFWINSNKTIESYRLTTVTYGLNCAPFSTLRCMQQLVTDEGHRHPAAIPPLTKGRYVDIIGGADTIAEAEEIKNQLTLLCKAGCFPLQKWKSNCAELIKGNSIGEDSSSTLEFEASTHKILGLAWHPEADSFHFLV